MYQAEVTTSRTTWDTPIVRVSGVMQTLAVLMAWTIRGMVWENPVTWGLSWSSRLQCCAGLG